MPEDDVAKACQRFLASDAAPEEKIRAEYQVIRYYMERGNREKGQEHLERLEGFLGLIPEDAPAVRRDIAEGDRMAAVYYVHGGIGNGLANSGKIRELYGKYPEEISVVLNEAFRYLYTPPIAGGSSKKAMRILREINPETLSVPDLFSYYVAMAMVLSDQEDFDGSDEYVAKALGFYTADPGLEQVMRDNRRGRIQHR